jgi:hypothetical protein
MHVRICMLLAKEEGTCRHFLVYTMIFLYECHSVSYFFMSDNVILYA